MSKAIEDGQLLLRDRPSHVVQEGQRTASCDVKDQMKSRIMRLAASRTCYGEPAPSLPCRFVHDMWKVRPTGEEIVRRRLRRFLRGLVFVGDMDRHAQDASRRDGLSTGELVLDPLVRVCEL